MLNNPIINTTKNHTIHKNSKANNKESPEYKNVYY